MRKLVRGLHRFQQDIFATKKELFERLAHGQKPDALLITCSDSRISPNLITQTEPGELFILRNAGNIVPSYSAAVGGEAATIEFAITALGIKDIIICGHSQCGAIQGLMNPELLGNMDSVASWLSHAEATRRIVQENYASLSEEEKLNVAIQENVLVQIENLKTLPVVASSLARGDLSIHGWVYKFQTGEIFSYDPEKGQFLPILETSRHPGIASRRLAALESI